MHACNELIYAIFAFLPLYSTTVDFKSSTQQFQLSFKWFYKSSTLIYNPF